MMSDMAALPQDLIVTINTDEAVAKMMELRSEIESTASHLRMLRDESNLTAAAMTKAAAEVKMAAEVIESYTETAEETP